MVDSFMMNRIIQHDDPNNKKTKRKKKTYKNI
jgi:hypothetical protein